MIRKLMTKALKGLLIALAVLCVSPFAGAQTALTQTTLTSNINNSQACFALASVTGISTSSNNATGGTTTTVGQQSAIYIDRELGYVQSINSTAKTVCVLRGMGGTLASSHAGGKMVLIGSPNACVDYDPAGFCGTSTPPNFMSPYQFTPWVNQRTGDQWLCSSVTNTWVPGFGNSRNPSMSTVTAAVASAAGQVTPSGPLFHITGALAITGFLIPVGCDATAVGGCQFTVIPDGTFTWTTANNIAIAGTAVVNKALTFTWDAKNSKWVPSYLS